MKSARLLFALATTLLGAPVQSSIADWTSSNLAGNGLPGSDGDGGPAILARLDNPFGLVRGPDGALWFCDYAAHVIRRIGPDGILTTVAGTGAAGYTGDGGPAPQASFNHPHEIRFDRDGNLFIADTSNHIIRRLDAKTKIISTIAGIGKPGFAGDNGPAAKATLNSPISIQLSPAGDLFIADIGNHVIRRVDAKTQLITTFAGTGKPGKTPDSAPISGTPLNGPRSLDFDSTGSLWLVTREGNQVFRFDLAKGELRRMAGSGRQGFTGDGGSALGATFAGPKGIAIAPNGDVYLADTENHAIRRLNLKDHTVERVAGTGTKGDGPEGMALQTKLARPHGVFVDADGSVFIGDSENHRIRVIRRSLKP